MELAKLGVGNMEQKMLEKVRPAEPEIKKKKRKVKQPNPLSCKKKKKAPAAQNTKEGTKKVEKDTQETS
jgi:hypothetical protein